MSAADTIERVTGGASPRARAEPAAQPAQPSCRPSAPASAVPSAANVICPVEALGREMKALQDADEAAASAKVPHQHFLKLAQQEDWDLEFALCEMASLRRATSPAGAMVQVAAAYGSLDCILDSVDYVDAESDRHAREHARRAKRCLYSVMGVLEGLCSVPRASVGVEYRMSSATDPFGMRDRLLVRDFVGISGLVDEGLVEQSVEDARRPALVDGDLAEHGAARERAEREWLEFEPIYVAAGARQDALMKTGGSLSDPDFLAADAVITRGNELQDRLEQASRTVLDTPARVAGDLKMHGQAIRSAFASRINVPEGDRDWQIEHLLLFLDRVEEFSRHG